MGIRRRTGHVIPVGEFQTSDADWPRDLARKNARCAHVDVSDRGHTSLCSVKNFDRLSHMPMISLSSSRRALALFERAKTSPATHLVKITQQHRKYSTINCDTPFNLCFLRHGQSTWNRDNRFIGWTDTPLTDDGVLEARVAGQMLHKSGILFDEVHTSLLRRSIRTTNLVLMEMGQEYIPVHKSWRLNERNYGNLVGAQKKEMVKLYGKDQVRRWRRSWDEPPPPMEDNHKYHPARDPRYRLVRFSLFLYDNSTVTLKP